MGIAADLATTHIRRVGTGKGPAVQTVRVHVCKDLYPLLQRQALEEQPGLDLLEGEVADLTREGDALGLEILSPSGRRQVFCKAAVLTTGTFLNGVCHVGERQTSAGRHGEPAVSGLSRRLAEFGIRLRRFKTGTTPRVRLGSIDFDATEEMPSEPEVGPISYLHDRLPVDRPLLSCHRTATNEKTHRLIASNLERSALFGGRIQGVGPRYCPSIEDKVVRFADKLSHPVFLERETWDGESVYVQGFSSSLPEEVQIEALRTIPGLEQCEVLRAGYAVEYDMADPTQLDHSLMSREVPGLFLAGQINGTTGYEEAGAQGIVAGINAARRAGGQESVTFDRAESYLGVLIDDLVTRGVSEPYRMFTSRSEYRLSLRIDNVDERLTGKGQEIGCVGTVRAAHFERSQAEIRATRERLQLLSLTPQEAARHGLELNQDGIRRSAYQLLSYPSIGWSDLSRIWPELNAVSAPIRERLETDATYAVYLDRQQADIAAFRRDEGIVLEDALDFTALPGLSNEIKAKLDLVRPKTLGQAARIEGITPAALTLLAAHAKKAGTRSRRTGEPTAP